MQLWQSRLRAESSCVAAPGCRPPSLLACNAVVLLCSGGSRPPDSAMPGPSTAKQAAAAPLVKSHRADWPLPAETHPTQPAKARAVQTCHRSLPRRRGSPRGGRSGQKLSRGSLRSPSSVAAALRRLAKTRLGRTAPAQLALPASRYCTELRPSQGRTLGQNKLIKCKGGQIRQCPESQNLLSTPKATPSHI